MTIFDRLLGKKEEPVEDTPPIRERYVGKIIKVHPDGWGFITTKEIQFTRIFYHWSGLNQDTLHFTELEKGMDVEFEVIEVPYKGLRAIKIKVLENENEDSNQDQDEA